jgi:hypothetical protein
MKTGRFAFWLSLLFSMILMINMLPCSIWANTADEETPSLSSAIDFTSDEYAITTLSFQDADAKSAYLAEFKVVGGLPPYTWSFKKGAKLPSPLSIKPSKDDSSIGIVSGKPSKPGDFPFTIQVTDSQKTVAEKSAILHINPAVSFSFLPPLPAGEAGVDLPVWTPTALGGNGAYSWKITKGVLPKGLNLDSTTGAISGNPQESGTYKFTLAVTDTLLGTAGKALTLKVYPALVISDISLPPADINVTYKTTTLKSTGGASKKTWSIIDGSLPDTTGLSMNNKGVFKGKPLPGSSDIYDFTVQVSDGIGVAEKDFSITIFDPLAVSPLPDGFIGRPYSWELNASGGSGGYKFKIVGALPAGLKYTASTATISGTPLSVGTSSLTIKVTDSLKGAVTSPLTLTVKETGEDTQQPTVVSVTPKQAATNVTVAAPVSAVFSENMNASSLNTRSFTLRQGNTAIPGIVTYDLVKKTASFTPSSLLSSSTTYIAALTTGVKDDSGNSLAEDYFWTFTTATLPEVVSVTPLNNSTDILRFLTINAVFSKDINVNTLNSNTFTLKQGNTEIPGIVTYYKQTKTASFTPSAALSPNAIYRATLTKAIKDTADNPLAADFSWKFTTGTVLISVGIAAPAAVAHDELFTVEIKINDVIKLNAYQFQITYDNAVIQLVNTPEIPGVDDGEVNGTVIYVSSWSFVDDQPGTIRILGMIPGSSQDGTELNSASGQGYLAKLHFKAIGSAGQSSSLAFTTGLLFENNLFNPSSLKISCEWQNASLTIGTP